MEIEIRLATISACEQLKRHCNLTAAEVDLAIWLLSQDLRHETGVMPHHQTVSSYY
jgi:hypothetical protein